MNYKIIQSCVEWIALSIDLEAARSNVGLVGQNSNCRFSESSAE